MVKFRVAITSIVVVTSAPIYKYGTPCMIFGICDASIREYTAVVYLRISAVPRNRCIVFLVGTKSKWAAPKSLSVPRLELNAALDTWALDGSDKIIVRTTRHNRRVCLDGFVDGLIVVDYSPP